MAREAAEELSFCSFVADQCDLRGGEEFKGEQTEVFLRKKWLSYAHIVTRLGFFIAIKCCFEVDVIKDDIILLFNHIIVTVSECYC